MVLGMRKAEVKIQQSIARPVVGARARIVAIVFLCALAGMECTAARAAAQTAPARSASSATQRATSPSGSGTSPTRSGVSVETIGPAPVPPNLLAHGSPAYFWIASIGPNTGAPGKPALRTRIFSRATNKPDWVHLSDLPAQAVGLASNGTQLAVLLRGGEWQLLSEDGIGSTGQPLPGDARMVALSNDVDALWAVGAVPAAPLGPAGSQPAAASVGAPVSSETRSAATQPAQTQPAHSQSGKSQAAAPPLVRESSASLRLVLFVMKEGSWERAASAPLPKLIDPNTPISLALVAHSPWVAAYVQGAKGPQIAVFRWSGTSWARVAAASAPAAPNAFKLLENSAIPILWSAANDHDWLEVFSESAGKWSGRRIALKPLATPVDDRAGAFAISSIRDIAVVGGRLQEQDYNRDTFASDGSTAPVSLPGPNTPSMFTGLYRIILTIVLVFAIFSSARRRRDPAEQAALLANVPLAPLGRRLAAGLIDAFPFLAPVLLFAHFYRTGLIRAESNTAAFPQGRDMELILCGCAALLVYLIHTALGESLTSRSLGKWLLGLRVVSMDGTRPDSSSFLIRNFLRVVDVGLFAFPLLLIVYSPTRQRIGDVAAGTLVIRDRVKPEGTLIEPSSNETAAVAPGGDTEPPRASEKKYNDE